MTPPAWATVLEFSIDGKAYPQGSHIAIKPKYGGPDAKPIVIESAGPPLKAWRKSMTAAARDAAGPGWRPIAGPVVVRLTFRTERPASVPLRVRRFPSVKPDVDKLARACLDSLTAAHVYADDGQVVDLRAVKIYAARPGLDVRVLTES